MKRIALVQKVQDSVKRLGLKGPGVVAVSGGPDSVALLRALLESQGEPLIVAHLNHQLRGDESDSDEAFVRGLHSQLSRTPDKVLALRCDRIDVRGAAVESGENLEATARQIRYEWLAGVARQSGSAWVATGHTADDQAETVLHRLLRGTGLQGLRGIAPRRPLCEGVEVVRPILTATRADVLDYLHALDQPSCHDSSNADLTLTRNRIRRELIPLLSAAYNTKIVDVLARLAEQAHEAFAEEEELAATLVAENELPRAGPWLVFDQPRLAALPKSSVRVMSRFVWRREGWPVGKMDFAHWARLADFINSLAPTLELPDGVEVQRRKRTVIVGRRVGQEW